MVSDTSSYCKVCVPHAGRKLARSWQVFCCSKRFLGDRSQYMYTCSAGGQALSVMMFKISKFQNCTSWLCEFILKKLHILFCVVLCGRTSAPVPDMYLRARSLMVLRKSRFCRT